MTAPLWLSQCVCVCVAIIEKSKRRREERERTKQYIYSKMQWQKRISKCDLFLLVSDVNVREIEKLENIIHGSWLVNVHLNANTLAHYCNLCAPFFIFSRHFHMRILDIIRFYALPHSQLIVRPGPLECEIISMINLIKK